MTKSDHQHEHASSHKTMMVLCIFVTAGSLFLFADAEEGFSLSVLTPLLLCLGMHFLMHRFMGHGAKKEEPLTLEPARLEAPAPIKKSDSVHQSNV